MTYTRRAVASDMPALLAQCRAFHAESPVHSVLPFDEDTVCRLIESCLDHPEWLAVVAIDDAGELAGMLLLYCMQSFFSLEREAADLTFYVAPAYRGGRTAIHLLGEATKWAEQQGAARLQIGITTGINTDQAERFFAKYHFARTGVLMQRSLA